MAWADRASPSEGWGLRWVRWKPGELAPVPTMFSVPPGGLGSQVMSPAIIGLAGGSFLFVWTEGPTSTHQVRAQIIGPAGTPIGEAITISPEGINAGQPQGVVLGEGQGVIAFLAAKGNGYEAVASPIKCSDR